MNSAHTAVLQSDSSAAGQARFADTLWSVVLRAGQTGSPLCQEALERLCRTYWPPLYAYVRRRGFSPADAQDLTQEFFARLLAKDYLAQVDRGKGKFRSFLLAALKHFLANEWDRAQAKKRGGGCVVVSLDEQDAEGRYLQEPASDLTPEMLYEKRWARRCSARCSGGWPTIARARGRQLCLKSCGPTCPARHPKAPMPPRPRAWK